MNANIKILLIAIIASLIGLGAGYFIFSQKEATVSNENPTINQSENPQIWTCAMHPQIRRNEPGQCPICEMDLIPLETSSSNDPLVLEMTPDAVKLANIQTTVVGHKANQAGKVIRLSGKVQADERSASSQVAHVPGRIEKLYITFTGEQVTKGQKLALLYSPELITAQQELLESLKLKALNPGLLEAARNKLRFWKIDSSTIEAIEKNGKIQETFTVFADASGIVTNRRIAVGDYLKKGEPLFDLISLKKVWVLFDAYEEDLADIKIGDQITFTTPALPNKTFQANITFIDPFINPKTRVATLRVEVNNSNGLLKPELFVTGTLQKKAVSNNNLSVPKSAVLWTGKRSVVYVKVPDNPIPSFQYREVEIGEALGENYQILNGLEAGEEVVTYGSFTIDAAAQLNNQVSMMNKNVMLKGADHSEHFPDYTESTPNEFKQQLVTVSDAYLQLKDAFVATDKDKAATTANQLSKALTIVDMALIKGAAHMYWMDQHKAMQAHSQKISELDEVEEQRKQFDFLSQTLIKTIKAFGVPNDTLYVLHCPMANDSNGADWISKEKEIQNPYFGDKMLTCGLIQETITKDFKNPPMEQITRAPQQGHNH